MTGSGEGRSKKRIKDDKNINGMNNEKTCDRHEWKKNITASTLHNEEKEVFNSEATSMSDFFILA